MNKYCQGPDCHTNMTNDRKRGPKGEKYFQTRTVGKYGYGNGDFCTLNCQNDWWTEHGTSAVDHAGRLHQPRVMTVENSWQKLQNYYTWQRENGEPQYYFYNTITRERRPLTESQFNDNNYTLNER